MSVRTCNTTGGPRARGVALLEVLVAVTLLSLTLIGGLTMVVHGLRVGRESLLRSTAAVLAGDLADRIRANAAAAAYDAPADGALPSVDPCPPAAPCDPSMRAIRDLAEWRQRVSAALPGGVGLVEPVPEAAVTGARLIEIRWVATGIEHAHRLVLIP